MKRLLAPCLMLTLAVVASAADKSELATNTVSVPEHGTLWVKAPKIWSLTAGNSGNRSILRTAELVSGNGNIGIQITVYRDEISSNAPGTTEDKLAQIVKTIGENQFVGQSVEKKVVVEKFSGPHASGRFARFTDIRWVNKTPPAGEFNNVATGVFQCGDLWGAFTLLTHDRDGPEFKQAMGIIESLEQEKRAP
jgi:hypothetical protein